MSKRTASLSNPLNVPASEITGRWETLNSSIILPALSPESSSVRTGISDAATSSATMDFQSVFLPLNAKCSFFMTRLSVNINKVATLRNARGGNVPNVLKVASDCERFGAEGITVHPRPDERHIRFSDVEDLAKSVTTEFNIEGYPSDQFVNMVLDAKPGQVTLVPDGPDVLTSNAGWDTVEYASLLGDAIKEFGKAGIRTSIFMEHEPAHIEGAKKVGADRIELYTEAYAVEFSKDKHKAVLPYVRSAELAQSIGLGVNAGHDLDLKNLAFFASSVPNLLEVSIGHALISDALYLGLETTVKSYLNQLKG